MIYFNIFGIEFNKISMLVLFLIISAASYITSKKFSNDALLHIGFISLIVSLFLGLFELLSFGYVIIIVFVISILGNLIKNNKLKIDFDIVMYALSFVSIIYILIDSASNIEKILLTVITICSLFIKAYITKYYRRI